MSQHPKPQNGSVDATGRDVERSGVGLRGMVVLTGNPNCGKTTLFNALTGLRAKVGNYAGVTVERKEGRLQGVGKEDEITILDLPGTYSLSPRSMDERVSRDVLFQRVPEIPPPDLVVVVVDASNLQRNLYYATQILEFGYPTLIALNMLDVARTNGEEIDARGLERELGAPVIEMVASSGEGLEALRTRVMSILRRPERPVSKDYMPELSTGFRREWEALTAVLRGARTAGMDMSRVEALLLLSDERFALEAS